MSRSAFGWALGRALRFAVGTCVVGLLLATTLSGEAAERVATAAYIAAIFAAFALALRRYFPTAAQDRRPLAAPFPAFLGYSAGIVVVLSVVCALVSQPAAELVALVGAVVLIVTAVLVRCGALAAFNASLADGGVLIAARRYAVVVLLAALALAAVLGSQGESLVRFAFRVTVVATILIAASLLAPTKSGVWLQKRYIKMVNDLDRLAHRFVFERAAGYAAVAAAAAMILAALLPYRAADVFAVMAYGAAAAAAFSVAMECRRLRQ